MEKTIMNVKEVSEYTHLAPNTIYSFVYLRKIPFQRRSEKKVVFIKKDIDQWMEFRKKDKKASFKNQTDEINYRQGDVQNERAPAKEALCRKPKNMVVFSFMVILSFIFGYFVSQQKAYKRNTVPGVPYASEKNDSSSKIDMGSMIENAQINGIHIDPGSFLDGRTIGIKLDQIKNIEIKGNPTSDIIMPILIYILKNEHEDYSTKSASLDIIKPHVGHKNFHDALIDVLEKEKNPAIRMKVLSILSEEISRASVKKAVINRLLNDENEAVRFKAIEILKKDINDQFIGVLVTIKDSDKSDLIRDRANRIYHEIVRKI